MHFVACGFFFNPLMLELNPSDQCCLLKLFTGAFKFECLLLEKKKRIA